MGRERLVKNMSLKHNSTVSLLFFICLLLVAHFAKYFLINKLFDNTNLLDELAKILVTVLFWIVPVWIYVSYVMKEATMQFLKLTHKIMRNIGIGLLLSSILGVTFIIFFKMNSITPSFYGIPNYILITTFLVSPLVEEVVFRGFILQTLEKKNRFLFANLITSFLFLLSHFPQWIVNDRFIHMLFSRSSLYIIGGSLILGYVFYKTKSLYPPLLLHATYNYFAVLLIFSARI
jgi:membrane protease YdiL (CAAX protease family)